MAGFKVQQDVCHGRDFTAPAGGVKGGLLYCITQFMPLALVSGGAGWYAHDVSQQSAGTDPYVVYSTHNAAGPNVPAKYIQFLLPTATGSQIRVMYWLYWDPVNHVGRGLYGAHNVRTDDGVDFIYDLRGGPECFFIHTYTTANTWEGSWIDEITLDSNLVDSVSATTAVANYSDGGNFQLRGFDILGGSAANLVDANGYTYWQVELVSGSTYRINVYKASARGAGDLVWRSSNFTALTANSQSAQITGTAQNSSGITLGIYLDGGAAGTTADNTIIFRYNQITVGTGEGAQFTVGNYYFIYDLTARVSVNSFKVISKSGDVLTIDRVYRPFPLGSKIGTLPHPFFVGGTGGTLWNNRCGLPYYGFTGSMSTFVASQSSGTSGGVEISNLSYSGITSLYWASYPGQGPSAVLSMEDNYITRQSPNRKGLWALQRPGVVERNAVGEYETLSSFSAKAALGQLKNVIVGAQGTMAANLNGRTLGGIDYLFFRLINTYGNPITQSWAACIRDSQSDT